ITGQSCPLSFKGRPYWMAPECPQHPNGYVCGCYDMRWMYNITFHYSTGKKKDFEKLMADSSMSLDDIDDIKEVWATKCSENM
ncbi:hypothetical protein KSS87_003144, partial [Heliosperma pusillum]